MEGGQRDPGRAPRGSRVALFARYELGAAAGNAVAARALIEGLEERGLEVVFVGPSGDWRGGALAPDICHALHAGPSATAARACAEASGAPLVITVTGTDLEGWTDEVDENLGRADAIIALSAHQEAALIRAGLGERVVLIGQGLDLDRLEQLAAGARGGEFDGLGVLPARTRVAVLLAGLRPVKDLHMALDAFARLASSPGAGEAWRLLIAGDVVDEEYAEGITRRVDEMANVVLLDALPHDAALRTLSRADVALNTSVTEGESRTILEALALGVQVVARDNAGNRQLLAAAEDGQLFRSAEELAAILEEMGRAGEPARTGGPAAPGFTALLRPTLSDEIAAHLELYGRLSIR
ncbi:MAG: glycosyltransferase [Planctomycetota bacterium]|nr:glycosyltransferase [Planctomycetota bacterium]